MSKKESFIQFVEMLIDGKNYEDEFPDAMDYWNALKITEDESKPAFTENGKLILAFMQQNKSTYNNLFKSKDIGEQISLSSRTVSGGMRKLVNDGYVEKIGQNPVIYAITTKGEEVNLEADSAEA